MNSEEFELWAVRAAEWAAEYRRTLRDLPVRPNVAFGDIAARLPVQAPETAEPMDAIVRDFQDLIVPGMTHWQHPRFFAYFPANAAPAAVVAEILVSAMAAQCMLWQTSPAATELEMTVVAWLRDALGLPTAFTGVLQDSASTATLSAVLTMRERALAFQGNTRGLSGQPAVRVYCSDQVHSSIDKACWISGIGQDNLVKLPGRGPSKALDPAELEAAIVADRDSARLPAGIVACVGGTSVGASDDVAAVVAVARRHGLFVHVDAAWAGSAMICPEYRSLWAGVEDADSVVTNPHKWLGAPFECAAHFIRDAESHVRTLAIQPEYLKTYGEKRVINYSEWSVPLGRRFRALKLWFLLRAYGLEGLRAMIRNHVRWAEDMAAAIRDAERFDLVTNPVLSLFAFRWTPAGATDLDAANLALVEAVNRDGRVYLTQTRHDGRIAIRIQFGSFEMTEEDAREGWRVIREVAAGLRLG
ncbi:pyridoxal phosphate-dependent decarboxylase family protein [Chthonobacter rhizosphaerae]|uniref:pyridoxal phosphate-dependent decarboxylase family protein n=1 Tax=Chthonobacter rhizosphaerae TaxID=2735553 RepID=UPI0015EF4C8E|nr:pyridoxal-dependent decarboxylase [Chthonobacter rhizosphaerae]